ncbi:PKD domain-containing protein [Ferrimonas sp. SCSIO 43195]|uniref:PKD domain-containing protein n=1 Tax=Ferrimonas sp. SCSIO 43195 TaxID=2822844 RepID=UPI0020758AA0|nr:PKD domain-containing protein [Ferrimonas sp. SCSIO 43195]USD36316.1 PKD domain-containing protein [Ferrimonas sp. SCSIO 43195]
MIQTGQKVFYQALCGASLALLVAGCNDSSSDSNSDNANALPTAKISAPSSLLERQDYTLSAADSDDSDGQIVTYQWQLDSGDYQGDQITLTGNGEQAQLKVGELKQDQRVTVILTVIDDQGDSNNDSITLNLQERDQALLPPPPPQPDATVPGVDSDQDGVRDDVEIKILALFPLSKPERELYRLGANQFAEVVIAGTTDDDIKQTLATQELAKMSACFVEFYGMDSPRNTAQLRALILNTRERQQAYEAFNRARMGTVSDSVDPATLDCRLPQE